jgi:NADPH-dependent 2,4-dienoyl-CoA reductase/sulfur reductase-like enzyme/rhodanese-related sulfurtransferase
MKLVIIGGGAGGPTAAARARRLDEFADIVMLERGEDVSFAHCGLPYYIGGVISDRGNLLVSSPQQLRQRYNIDVRTSSEVKRIIPESKQVEVVDLPNGNHYYEPYDRLILSPGAEPIRPGLSPVSSDRVFVLRNLADADDIFKFIHKKRPRRIVCIGGGFIGLEMVENLKLIGMEVTIVEMADQVLPPLDREMAEIVKQTLLRNDVRLILSDAVASITEHKKEMIVKLSSGDSISGDMVLLAAGVKPRIELAREAGIEIGKLGGIKVNKYLQTSAPDIYAVGDCVETEHLVTGRPVLIPLAGPANRQARVAVDNIYGRNIVYRGTLGTAIVSVFETTAAITGASEKTLIKSGIAYAKCYLHPFDHATYYPDAAQMALKLLFSPDDGRVLGAQIVGGEGIDKRIDVLATAIMARMTVDELAELQLAYVPQFGSAKDAVNMAGYVASNIWHGDAPTTYWDTTADPAEKTLLLDVRNKTECRSGTVPNSKNIPLDELRSRLGELPEDTTIEPYCVVGIRSYVATRILQQRGYRVKNISGGFRSYQSTKNGESSHLPVNCE